VDRVEDRIAALEGAERSLLFSSGMAALHAAIVSCAPTGSALVVSRRLYGGTHDLLTNGLVPLGYSLRTVDIEHGAGSGELDRALEGARLLICESLANPTLEVADLDMLAQRTHAAGALLLVDATFASPISQRPIQHGVDLVMHSATKLLGGHSDLIAGVLSGTSELLRPVLAWRKRAGGCLAPDAAWLLDRGLKTLALRVRAQSANAARVAAFLDEHPAVRRTVYPGLPSHPSHSTARRMLEHFGCMIGCELVGGDEAGAAAARALRLWLDAPSLGGVESLVSLPRLMSHALYSDDERRSLGIGAGYMRLSVGIEDADDLIADLDRGLSAG
jgi:cystathionine gamma-synthase